MAKDKADKKIGKSAADHGFKYGINDLAKRLDTDPQLARGRLRRAEIAKSDKGVYGWRTDKDLDSVVKQLQAPKPKSEKAEAKPAPKPDKAPKAEKKASRAEATA